MIVCLGEVVEEVGALKARWEVSLTVAIESELFWVGI